MAKQKGFFWAGLGDAMGKIYGISSQERLAKSAQDARGELAGEELAYKREKMDRDNLNRQAALNQAKERLNQSLSQGRNYEQSLAYKGVVDALKVSLDRYNKAVAAAEFNPDPKINAMVDIERDNYENALQNHQAVVEKLSRMQGFHQPQKPQQSSKMDILLERLSR